MIHPDDYSTTKLDAKRNDKEKKMFAGLFLACAFLFFYSFYLLNEYNELKHKLDYIKKSAESGADCVRACFSEVEVNEDLENTDGYYYQFDEDNFFMVIDSLRESGNRFDEIISIIEEKKERQ